MEDDGKNNPGMSRIFVLLTGVATAAMVLTIYHCYTVGCNRRRFLQGNRDEEEIPSTTRGMTSSMVDLIPSYKYDKEAGLIGEEGVCAVCLSEFEEGEEVRTLPECVHSFHMPCIDMWLYSHTSCPLCRTDTTPPRTETPQRLSNSNGLLPFQSMTQNSTPEPPQWLSNSDGLVPLPDLTQNTTPPHTETPPRLSNSNSSVPVQGLSQHSHV